MKADDLTIREPCAEDWSAMTGDGPRRHCDACQRSVHNLSEMTKPEADALLESRTGRLCVRYTINPDGTVRFRPEPIPAPALVQLRERPPAEPRRAAALTGAAMAASLLAACTPHTHDDSPNGCLDGAIELFEARELGELGEFGEMGELVQEPQGFDPMLAPLEPIQMPGAQVVAPPPPPPPLIEVLGAIPPQDLEPPPPPLVEVQGGIPPQDLEPPPPPPVVDPFPELMGDVAAPDPVEPLPWVTFPR